MSRLNGESRFEALDKSWVFKLGYNAVCALEEAYNLPFLELVLTRLTFLTLPAEATEGEKVRAMRLARNTDVRQLLMTGLREHHSDITLDQAGSLIDAIGFRKISEVISAGIMFALDVPEEKEAGAAKENPTKAARKGSTRLN